MQTDHVREGTILLVDTRPAVLRRYGDLLQRAGYDVVQAATFDDAKHALCAQRPQLVISHLRLAAFNGLHLVHLGHLAQPDLDAIIITGESDLAMRAEAERLGATVLVEPVHSAELLSAVARVIKQDVTAEWLTPVPRPKVQAIE